jgi:putative transposase
MSTRPQLSDAQWATLTPLLALLRRSGRPGRNDRNFIEAVLWWRRTGIPWRDLPPSFGPWKSVYNRFDNWSKRGWWTRLFLSLRQHPDLEWLSIDGTVIRSHQHAAGAKGGPAHRP